LAQFGFGLTRRGFLGGGLVALGLTPGSVRAETGLTPAPALQRGANDVAVPVSWSHAIAMHGKPKYPPGFTHLDYADPKAPKGGQVVQGATGGFDSFNAFIDRGQAAAGIGLTVNSLLYQSGDEAFTMYGEVVASLMVPDDRSWIQFKLRPEARWHDGQPITAEDVVWTFNFLVDKGRPLYRFYYANVKEVTSLGPHALRFDFEPGVNLELPLIVGQLPIMPKHYWTSEGRDPTKTTLTPPLGSGPYRVADFEPNRWVEYELVEDYWGKNIAVELGRNNFKRLRYDYYLDRVIERQAVKAAKIDLFQENESKSWATAYNIPQVTRGDLQKVQFPIEDVGRMQCFVMNQRRTLFQDWRVRYALCHAFDFEWTNRNLFYGLYKRCTSYFYPTELMATGLPTPEQLEILAPYRGRVPEEVFTQVYEPPVTDGSGWPRANLEKAFALLAEAGWVVRDLKLVNAETGEPFRFEILLVQKNFERIVLPFRHNLERLGMEVSIRTVDAPQFINRIRSFDFDMTSTVIANALSPGNEQRDYWSSAAADRPGSRNLCGVKDPVVDELVDLIIEAPDRESLVTRCRCLDRVLLWHHLVIPQWASDTTNFLVWNKFGWPETKPLNGYDLSTWWYDERKAERLKTGEDDPAWAGEES